MDKKVVVVTGGSKGIGKSIVYEFAKNNYNVVFTYLNSTNYGDIKNELEKKYNIEVLPIKVDLSNEEDIKNMIDDTINKFNRIDCLVNNAGIAIDTIFDDKTKDNFMKILDVNLIGPFLICKYAYKYMMDNSSIINISSTNGIDTLYPESMDYDASKAGLISLTKNLAKEFSPRIRVNSVAPGWVNTDMNKDLDDEFKKNEESKILLNRFGNPDEIAKVVRFLASNDASYINGEVIRVDGGVR